MQHSLRELAKVGVGLFIADLFSVLWLGSAGFFPLTVLGVTWTMEAILPIALFDVAVILILIHVGWRTKLPVRSPSERKLLMLAGFVFLVVTVVHLLRLALAWNLALGAFEVPLWLSWLGVAIAGYLSYSCFHFALRTKG